MVALEQLKQFSSVPNSPLTGVEPTINYMQSLGSEHIQIILENSEWVFKVSGCGSKLHNLLQLCTLDFFLKLGYLL